VKGEGSTAARPAGLALLLAAGMTASALNVPIFSVLSRPLVEDFGITRSQLGLLISATTGVAALLSPAAGALVDNFGSRRMMTTIFVVSLSSVLAISVAPSYLLLLATAAIAGSANALGNPAANKLIASQLPAGSRGLVMGIKQSGVQFGIMLGGLAFPPLSTAFGWRVAVAAAALLPALGILATRVVLQPDAPRVASHDPRPRYRHAPATWWLAVYALLMGAGTGSVGSFVPLYAQESLGMGIRSAGLAASTIGFIGVLTRIVWGVTSERRHHFSGPLALLGTLSTLAAACIWISAHTGPLAFWIGVGLAGLSVAAWNSVANLAATSGVDNAAVGRASGLVVGGFLAGFATSPTLFGLTVDLTGGYDVGWAATVVLFVIASGIAVAWGARTRRAAVQGAALSGRED
jgi:predicted MFS family arabinose efflux permease